MPLPLVCRSLEAEKRPLEAILCPTHNQDSRDQGPRSLHLRISAPASDSDLPFLKNTETRNALFSTIRCVLGNYDRAGPSTRVPTDLPTPSSPLLLLALDANLEKNADEPDVAITPPIFCNRIKN